jgi:hypothetical protein
MCCVCLPACLALQYCFKVVWPEGVAPPPGSTAELCFESAIVAASWHQLIKKQLAELRLAAGGVSSASMGPGGVRRGSLLREDSSGEEGLGFYPTRITSPASSQVSLGRPCRQLLLHSQAPPALACTLCHPCFLCHTVPSLPLHCNSPPAARLLQCVPPGVWRASQGRQQRQHSARQRPAAHGALQQLQGASFPVQACISTTGAPSERPPSQRQQQQQ